MIYQETDLPIKSRSRQIGIFGTFDVENYGDLLFPLIAEAELTERLGEVELHRFSYHAKTPSDWPYAVTSLTDLPQIASRLDAAIIGGGFILRFDKEVAAAYHPPTPDIHHPTGYWLTPALIALQQGVPVIWNAPGAFGDSPAAFGMPDNTPPAWAEPLMELAFANSSYIAVRDDQSSDALARFAGKSSITVMPDTAFGIARLLDDNPSREFNRLCDASGLTEPYVIIQAAHGLDFFTRFVSKHARRLEGMRFLALPIGPVLGNRVEMIDPNLPGLVRLSEWPHPLALAELISRAEAVVGHSYHLTITALACGVPVFNPVASSARRFAAFRDFETIHHLANDSEIAPDWFIQRVGKTEPAPAARAARDKLSCHWDRVAAVIEAGGAATQSAVCSFLQSLPGQMEAAAVRHHIAVRLLEEIKERDERIARLYNSPSMKATAPLRFLMRSMKRVIRKKSKDDRPDTNRAAQA